MARPAGALAVNQAGVGSARSFGHGFSYGWGVTGIWVGLTGALIAVGVILLLVWHREMKAAQR